MRRFRVEVQTFFVCHRGLHRFVYTCDAHHNCLQNSESLRLSNSHTLEDRHSFILTVKAKIKSVLAHGRRSGLLQIFRHTFHTNILNQTPTFGSVATPGERTPLPPFVLRSKSYNLIIFNHRDRF